MSYTLTVSGHNVTETPDEAQQIEQQALASARTFVGGLTGVTSAFFEGQHSGHTNLMEQPQPQTEAEA